MKEILVVVDMQNDFIDGFLGTREAMATVALIEERVRKFKGDIFFTRDTHYENYLSTAEGRNLPVEHCIKDSFGWQICDALLPYAKTVIDKPSFGSTELAEKIKEAAGDEDVRVRLVGLCTDICVISNALLIKAYLPEAEVEVEAALCAGVTKKSHERALEAMKMCQITVI